MSFIWGGKYSWATKITIHHCEQCRQEKKARYKLINSNKHSLVLLQEIPRAFSGFSKNSHFLYKKYGKNGSYIDASIGRLLFLLWDNTHMQHLACASACKRLCSRLFNYEELARNNSSNWCMLFMHLIPSLCLCRWNIWSISGSTVNGQLSRQHSPDVVILVLFWCYEQTKDVENESRYFDVALEAFNVFMKTKTGAF